MMRRNIGGSKLTNECPGADRQFEIAMYDIDLSMEDHAYRIVAYRPAFRNGVVQVQRHLWSSDPQVNSAYLQWKYERNPYLDEKLIYVALYGYEVVGMFGMHGTLWEIGESGQMLSVPSAGDAVTAPEHRNRGLFGRLLNAAVGDMATRGYTYSFTFSAGPITATGLLKNGWRTTGALRTMSRKTNEKTIAPVVKDSSFCHLDGPQEHGYKPRRDVVVERGPRPEAMARLVDGLGRDGRLRHVRDVCYFAWRFQNPLCEYRFLYYDHTELEGYLVLGKPPFAGVSIVDWEASDVGVRDQLLRAAVEWGRFEKLTIWSATLSGEVRKLLEKHGFKPDFEIGPVTDGNPVILVRDLRGPMAEADWDYKTRSLTDISNWDVRMIYSDAY